MNCSFEKDWSQRVLTKLKSKFKAFLNLKAVLSETFGKSFQFKFSDDIFKKV